MKSAANDECIAAFTQDLCLYEIGRIIGVHYQDSTLTAVGKRDSPHSVTGNGKNAYCL